MYAPALDRHLEAMANKKIYRIIAISIYLIMHPSNEHHGS
jgi:hypothetical protein